MTASHSHSVMWHSAGNERWGAWSFFDPRVTHRFYHKIDFICNVFIKKNEMRSLDWTQYAISGH